MTDKGHQKCNHIKHKPVVIDQLAYIPVMASVITCIHSTIRGESLPTIDTGFATVLLSCLMS